MQASIRFPDEDQQRAYELVCDRDDDAGEERPSVSRYLWEHIKPLLGNDLFGFLFDLQTIHRSKPDPTLEREEIMAMSGWRLTKTKEVIGRLRSPALDPDPEFQLLKLYVPRVRPAPHWHAKGSAAWQFILLNGEVLVDDENRERFIRTAAAFSRQRTLSVTPPQGFILRPKGSESDREVGIRPVRGRNPTGKGSESDREVGIRPEPVPDASRNPTGNGAHESCLHAAKSQQQLSSHEHGTEVPRSDEWLSAAAALREYDLADDVIEKLLAPDGAAAAALQQTGWMPYRDNVHNPAGFLIAAIPGQLKGAAQYLKEPRRARLAREEAERRTKQSARTTSILTARDACPPASRPDGEPHPTTPRELLPLRSALLAAAGGQLLGAYLADTGLFSAAGGVLILETSHLTTHTMLERKRPALLQLARGVCPELSAVAIRLQGKDGAS